jgi:hypothetical protein
VLFRFRHELLGAHVHVQVYAGRASQSLAKAGKLVFNEQEWTALMQVFDACPERIVEDGCVQLDVREEA